MQIKDMIQIKWMGKLIMFEVVKVIPSILFVKVKKKIKSIIIKDLFLKLNQKIKK